MTGSGEKYFLWIALRRELCAIWIRDRMLEELKYEVCQANLMLTKVQLIPFTWGNVSGIDRETGLAAIRPPAWNMRECSRRIW